MKKTFLVQQTHLLQFINAPFFMTIVLSIIISFLKIIIYQKKQLPFLALGYVFICILQSLRDHIVDDEIQHRKMYAQAEFVSMIYSLSNDQMKLLDTEQLLYLYEYLDTQYGQNQSFVLYSQVFDVLVGMAEQLIRIIVIDQYYTMFGIMFISSVLTVAVYIYASSKNKEMNDNNMQIQLRNRKYLYNFINQFKIHYTHRSVDNFRSNMFIFINEQNDVQEQQKMNLIYPQYLIQMMAVIMSIYMLQKEYYKKKQVYGDDNQDSKSRFFHESTATLLSLKDYFTILQKGIEIYLTQTNNNKYDKLKSIIDQLCNIYERNLSELHNQQYIIPVIKNKILYEIFGLKSRILRNIELTIYEGEKIAIVGENGNGKSTLLNILCGIYDIKDRKGEVLYKGIDINNLNKSAYYRQVAIVDQQQMLISDTIFNNIIIGMDLEQNNMKTVMKSIMKSVMKYMKYLKIDNLNINKNVDYMNLSGGQKQCIMIIRALIREPKVLFLDEYTSYLSQDKQNLVQKLIENYWNKDKTRTIISVTHFNEQLSFYNRIITISKGQVKLDRNTMKIKNKKTKKQSLNIYGHTME